MNRAGILIIAILTTVTVGFASQAMAFNFSWGKGTAVVPITQTTNGADIPTPQLFKLTAGQKPAHMTLSYAPNRDEGPSTLHLAQPQAQPKITTPPKVKSDGTTIAHHLNGPELFLLKQVQTLAKR